MISMNPTPTASNQIPLVVTVHEDDELLYNSPHSEWYRILKDLPYENYQDIAADYYNCLRHFNLEQQAKTKQNLSPNDESKDEAKQRLLFNRTTMNEDKPVLHEMPAVPELEARITPSMIAPGITPNWGAGKKPKCFFALLKSFIGASLMGFPSEPEKVHDLLTGNMSFVRVCGFIPKNEDEQYWYKHVPSRRKLEQFDQIMTRYGLWEKCKQLEILENICTGVIQEEKTMVGDTYHCYGYSGFEVVEYIDEKGKKATKSQSKVTKNCRCKDRDSCPHEWELADDGAGTIVKAHRKFIWGHKASIIGLPLQGIPLDAVAVADAATHDGETFFPHVVKLFGEYPILTYWINTALYDGACDCHELKAQFEEILGITLKTSLNPRRRKTVTDLPQKGMEKMTPYGTLVCKGGLEMDFKGARYEDEAFIYGAPICDGENACLSCEHKPTCCPNASNGRRVQIPFDTLPHINPTDPPMAKRFKALMTRRPSIERMIKRLKCDLGDDRLTKRSNDSFQAYLDKTMIAFHILLRN